MQKPIPEVLNGTRSIVLDKIPPVSQIPPSLPPQEKQQALYWGGSEEISPAIIKQATDEVVGQDTAPLFNLLEIQY